MSLRASADYAFVPSVERSPTWAEIDLSCSTTSCRATLSGQLAGLFEHYYRRRYQARLGKLRISMITKRSLSGDDGPSLSQIEPGK